jgi:protein-disulfide isomerase
MANPYVSPVPAASWPVRPVILGVLIFVAGVLAGYEVHDAWGASAVSPYALADTGVIAGAEINGDASNYSWGNPDAKVTMVEFGDFQCTFCRQWHQQVYPQLKLAYANSIRFIYRDLPLDFHADAEPAAEAARCAGEQGHFWDYFEALYNAPNGIDTDSRRGFAQKLGLNLTTFDQCVQSGRFATNVRLDTSDAVSHGVNGTPAFFINGRMIAGALPFAEFQKALDAALAK